MELVRTLPEIYQYFDTQTLVELVNFTFQIYGKTNEPGFRNKAMKSVAHICPHLPEATLTRILYKMKELINVTWEYTETAALIEAFTLVIQNCKIDFFEVCRILIVLRHFLVHPNRLILKKTLDLVELVYKTTEKADIVQVVSPILQGFTEVGPK